MSDSSNNLLSKLPSKTGVYYFQDELKNVIYVGKAKNIKVRCTQHFNASHIGLKHDFLSKIASIDFFLTKTEIDALILEQNLIKKYNPKFNFLLKDGKRYPYIQVTNEKYPRFLYTRKPNRRKGKVYGPFPDGTNCRIVFQFLNRVFPLRKCYSLPKQSCIYYSLKECLAPCVNTIDQLVYKNIAQQIDNFFKNKDTAIQTLLTNKMNAAAATYNYESASEYKKLLEILSNFMQQAQTVEFKDYSDRDYLGFYSNKDYVSLILLIYRNGKLINKHTQIFYLCDSIEAISQTFLFDFYTNNSTPTFLFVDHKINLNFLAKHFEFKVIYQKDSFSKIFSLARDNAKAFLNNKLESIEFKKNQVENAIRALKNALKINNLRVIETYDNSHLSTNYYVGCAQVYIDGFLNNKLNRKYNLKAIATNDIEAFKQVILKRYGKHSDLVPDAIFVDGAKAQVNIFKKTLKKIGYDKITIIGMVKNDKHKTKHLLYEDKIINIKKNPDVYNFIATLQENIHNYAISFFTKKQQQAFYQNELFNIKGVGKITVLKLLTNFIDIENIKNADLYELNKIIKNKNICKNIYEYFQKNTN